MMPIKQQCHCILFSQKSLEVDPTISPFYRWGNWGWEGVSALLRVTLQRGGSARIWTQFCLRPVSGCCGPGPYCHWAESSPRWLVFGCIRSQLWLMGLGVWRHVVFYFPDQGSNPSSCTGRWILNHYTTRKVLHFFVICVLLIHRFIFMIVFL